MSSSAAEPGPRVRALPERGGSATLWPGGAGGSILALRQPGPEISLLLGVRAPVPDDTGLAHVLEHLVLAGSRRHPGPGLYAALMQSSPATHLNATTEPELTAYTLAATERAAFARLAAIWGDAVFHPCLRAGDFAREAWSGPPLRPGVVMNEMRGYLADPLARLTEALRQGLMPDAAAGHLLGGDPARIPDLRLDALRRFHAHHYVAGNALAVVVGDLPPAEAHALVAPILAEAPPGPPRPLPVQPRWPAPRSRAIGLPGAAAPLTALGWWMPPGCGLWALVLAELLRDFLGDRVLPLPLLDPGTDPPVLRLVQAGAEGAALSRAVDALCADPPQEAALRAMARVSLALRVPPDPRRPAGVQAALIAARAWARGHDPLGALAFDAPLAALRAEVLGGGLGAMIARSLRDNPHHLVLTGHPAPVVPAPDAAPAAVLPRRRGGAGLPRFALADLALPQPVEPRWQGDLALCETPVPGVVRVDLALDPGGLSPAALALAGGLAAGWDSALRRDIAGLAGGLRLRVWAGQGRGGPAARLILSAAGTGEALPGLLAVLGRVLAPPPDPGLACLRSLIATRRDEIARRIAAASHEAAARQVRAALHGGGRLAEALEGHGALAMLRALAQVPERAGHAWADLAGSLHRMPRRLLLRAPAADLARLAPLAEAFLGGLPAAARPTPWPATLPPVPGEVLRHHPGAAAAAARGADLSGWGAQDLPALALAARHLATGILWQEIREAGGAYGAVVRFDPLGPEMVLVSWRDPHPDRSLAVMARAAEALRGLDPATLEQGAVAVLADLSRPEAPTEAGHTLLIRDAQGGGDPARLAQGLAGVSPADMDRLADRLGAALARGPAAQVLPAPPALTV